MATAALPEVAGPAASAFGVFRVAARYIAINAAVIQGVIAHPEYLTPIASVSSALRGVIEHRGTAVPVVSLRQLLGEETENAPNGNIVIIATRPGSVGLIVDDTDNVVRVRQDHVQCLTEPAPDGTVQLIRSVVRIPHSTRILPVLDSEALAAIPGVAFSAATDAATVSHMPAAATRSYLAFACGEHEFCVDTLPVREIVSNPDIEVCGLIGDLYHGMAPVRGGVVPVINLPALLSMPTTAPATKMLLVLEAGGDIVALLVSDIRSIQRRAVSDIVLLPGLAVRRADLITGWLADGTANGVPSAAGALVLAHEALHRDPDIASIQRLHARIRDVATRSAARSAYLAFDVGLACYTPLPHCLEIVAMPSEPFLAAQASGPYLGVMRRGRDSLPLISLPSLLRGDKPVTGGEARVVVVAGQKGKVGFVVHSAKAIEHFDIQQELGSAEALGPEHADMVRAVAQRIWVAGPDGPQSRTVLDLVRLADQFAG